MQNIFEKALERTIRVSIKSEKWLIIVPENESRKTLLLTNKDIYETNRKESE